MTTKILHRPLSRELRPITTVAEELRELLKQHNPEATVTVEDGNLKVNQPYDAKGTIPTRYEGYPVIFEG